MRDLIRVTRNYIGDAGPNPVFTDDDIQEALDARRQEARFWPLKALPTIIQGRVENREWYHDYYWEADAALYGVDFQPVTPVEADPLHGRWVFAEHQPMVWISGRVYDVFAACADLLETWAAKEKLSYDFASEGQSFRRSQKLEGLLKLAEFYRARQKVQHARVVRSDVNP